MGISFVRFNRRENRRSLAIFDCKEIAFQITSVGAGVLHKFGADFFCVFSAFTLQGEEIITPIFGTVFCADFGALIYAQIFAQIFCADFLRRFLRRFFVRGAQILAQIFLRRFGASKIGVPESRKNARKICGKICCVPRACPRTGP